MIRILDNRDITKVSGNQDIPSYKEVYFLKPAFKKDFMDFLHSVRSAPKPPSKKTIIFLSTVLHNITSSKRYEVHIDCYF
jgi:hypothetical protein